MRWGGEWKNGVGAKLWSARRIKIQFQGAGARPWAPERRYDIARGIYNRMAADDRFRGKQITSEVQWRVETLISGGGNSASQLVFDPNAVFLIGWDGKDGNSLFAQDASSSGQFAQRWGRPRGGGQQRIASLIGVQLVLQLHGCRGW